MRCELLLDALGSVDRSGREGMVAEVYPAASLRLGLPHHGLKGTDGLLNRNAVVARLEDLTPAMKFRSGARDRCVKSEHASEHGAVVGVVSACVREEGEPPRR